MLGQRSDRRSLLTAMCLVMVLVVPTGAYADEWTNRPVEELVRLAREGDFGVRYQAVVALGKLGGPLAQRTLVSSFVKDQNLAPTKTTAVPIAVGY